MLRPQQEEIGRPRSVMVGSKRSGNRAQANLSAAAHPATIRKFPTAKTLHEPANPIRQGNVCHAGCGEGYIFVG